MNEKGNKQGEMFRRFHPFRVFEHQANAVAFALLATTGLSQRFHDMAWAEWVILGLGGIDNVRLIHRATGLILVGLLLVHIAVAFYGIIIRRWRPSMMINRKDFTDAIGNLRYYLGISETPARCDRYDYKQKFEYWGVVVGGLLMGATGLFLWFPTLLFNWIPFLPGQMLPAAKAAHSNEAMLAFLVIVVWHIYNAIFSPEVFPLDTAIFTGKISKERMQHEHPVEYERLFGPIEHNAPEPATDATSDPTTRVVTAE